MASDTLSASTVPAGPGFFKQCLHYPNVMIGGVLLMAIVMIAILTPFLSQTDPTAINAAMRAQDPSSQHWFGTDMLGRDLYARVFYGAQVSLIVGFSVAVLSTLGGLVLGLLSGFIKVVDAVAMRIIDGLMSIPSILLAVALMSISNGSITNVIIAITLAELPRTARLVRGTVLSLREQPYVEAAVSGGSRMPTIILKHILPNTLAPIIIQATYVCASAMISESILSFIGAGTPPIIPSWGNIMAEGRMLWMIKPYIIFYPALFLSITVLAINLLGDGLRDMLDPRNAQRSISR